MVNLYQAVLDCARMGGYVFIPTSRWQNDEVKRRWLASVPGYPGSLAASNSPGYSEGYRGYWVGITDISHEGRQVDQHLVHLLLLCQVSY